MIVQKELKSSTLLVDDFDLPVKVLDLLADSLFENRPEVISIGGGRTHAASTVVLGSSTFR